MDPIPFDTCVSSLSRLSIWSDPTHATAQSAQIAAAVAPLEELPLIDRDSPSQWIHTHPNDAGALALVVGLSKEKPESQVRYWFGAGSPPKVAREESRELVDFFSENFDLIRLVNSQFRRTYTFVDILNARAMMRHSVVQAGESGRRVEDQIEAIAGDLSLPYEVRTRFEGRAGRSVLADLAVPGDGRGCVIVVVAKVFDFTESKLTDAAHEIEEMVDARIGNQIALAVADGIGWRGRLMDLRRIWSPWESGEIDGLFAINTLEGSCQGSDDHARIRMTKCCPRGSETPGSWFSPPNHALSGSGPLNPVLRASGRRLFEGGCRPSEEDTSFLVEETRAAPVARAFTKRSRVFRQLARANATPCANDEKPRLFSKISPNIYERIRIYAHA